jgi:hypothetical protein
MEVFMNTNSKWHTVIMAVAIIMVTSVPAFAQDANKLTLKTGETTVYYPKDVEAISFRDNTPLPILSSVKQYQTGIWEVLFTVAALSNSTADGTYPVVVSYYVKPGDTIQMKTNIPYIGDKSVELNVSAVSWNTITFDLPAADTKAPTATEDSL